MKGIILAGGLGTRLYPLTHATNKHLLPVYDQPMVYYPLQTLVNAGITEILIVTGGPHAGDFLHVVGTGKQMGVTHLEYTLQEKEGGIAQALALAEDFADGEAVFVILGDNCTDFDAAAVAAKFRDGALIFVKKVSDPQRFGVAHIVGDRVKEIIEKPKQPISNFAVTGLYIYDKTVFDKIKKIKPSARGELEITDVNNLYIKKNKLRHTMLDGFWSDAGTFESLFRTNAFWAIKKGYKK